MPIPIHRTPNHFICNTCLTRMNLARIHRNDYFWRSTAGALGHNEEERGLRRRVFPELQRKKKE